MTASDIKVSGGTRATLLVPFEIILKWQVLIKMPKRAKENFTFSAY